MLSRTLGYVRLNELNLCKDIKICVHTTNLSIKPKADMLRALLVC